MFSFKDLFSCGSGKAVMVENDKVLTKKPDRQSTKKGNGINIISSSTSTYDNNNISNYSDEEDSQLGMSLLHKRTPISNPSIINNSSSSINNNITSRSEMKIKTESTQAKTSSSQISHNSNGAIPTNSSSKNNNNNITSPTEMKIKTEPTHGKAASSRASHNNNGTIPSNNSSKNNSITTSNETTSKTKSPQRNTASPSTSHDSNGAIPTTSTNNKINSGVKDHDGGGHMISSRAGRVINTPSVTVKYNQKVGADRYHPQENPRGYVDLGLAENKLCEDLLTRKLKTIPDDTHSMELRYYPDVKGLRSFRTALANFMQREFKSRQPLDPDNFVVASGLTALLDSLAFSLADHGDYIMTTSPYYYRIKNDFQERASVEVLEVPLVAKPKSERTAPYTMDVAEIERIYLKAISEGKTVKAFLLVNPNNPLGDVCSPQQLIQLMGFTYRYRLHLIVDEIYAMSVFEKDASFTSILTLPHLDPERTHLLWGFSKDFGLSGYRCGVLYSENKSLVHYLVSMGLYQQTPPLVQLRLQHLIEDTDWLHREYFPELKSRLRHQFVMARNRLEACGVHVHAAKGGIFLWLDLNEFMPSGDTSGELWLFEQFMAEKVFLLPGTSCYSQDPGYFRVVFSLNIDLIQEGLNRIERVIQRIKADKS